MDKMYLTPYTVPTYVGNVGWILEDKKEVKKMKVEIEISDEEWRLMKRNRYGHGDVITQGYMLDILHDIVDQIHEEMH